LKGYALPAGLGAFEGGAVANISAGHDWMMPYYDQRRQAWEEYKRSLPEDHPDRKRAQAHHPLNLAA